MGPTQGLSYVGLELVEYPYFWHPLFKISQRLKILKEKVKEWNWYSFGNIFEQKKNTINDLSVIQTKMEEKTDEEDFKEEMDLRNQWLILNRKEEVLSK